MSALFRPRVWFSLIVLLCASLLGYALYVQHVEFLDPCPLCVVQRVAFIWIGIVALAAAMHNPGMTGRWLYSFFIALGALAGAVVAGRHIWLQGLPPGQAPECGMSLNYMLDSMPFNEVLSTLFHGSGECAKVDWTLAGLSMPWWTLFCYIGISVATLLVMSKNRS
ncbi:MAG: disulfide bond formation protein B [Lysobacterales bacterium]